MEIVVAFATASHAVTRLQSVFRAKQVQQKVEVSQNKAGEEELQRMKLQAIWQLFLTGFEVGMLFHLVL